MGRCEHLYPYARGLLKPSNRAKIMRAMLLFVYAWNRRQQAKWAFPKLPAEVCDFIADLLY